MYHSAFEGRLYRIDPETGELLWEWASRSGVAVNDDVVVVEDTVLVTTTGFSGADGDMEPPIDAHQLGALNPDSGEFRWSVDLDTDVSASPGSVAFSGDGTSVVHRPWTGAVEALGISDGSLRWSIPLPGGDSFRVSAASDDLRLYIAINPFLREGLTVRALDIDTGVERWRTDLGAVAAVALTADPDGLLVGTSLTQDASSIDADDQGRLARLDAVTGNEIGAVTTRDGITVPPIGAGGDLLLELRPFDLLRLTSLHPVRRAAVTVGFDGSISRSGTSRSSGLHSSSALPQPLVGLSHAKYLDPRSQSRARPAEDTTPT